MDDIKFIEKKLITIQSLHLGFLRRCRFAAAYAAESSIKAKRHMSDNT